MVHMNRLENISEKVDYFIFDLEFIGQVQDLNTCRIWEISVFAKTTNVWFTRVVDPDPHILVFPPPPIPELPQLTRDFLNTHQAQTWATVLTELIQWVGHQTKNIPVFISHNTFRADKPILELESKRYNLLLPLHWFFFDSLHFCRDIVVSKTGNFSLGGLHKQLFDKPIDSAHRAKNDVVACINIINTITNGTWRLHGSIYSVYTTSLRSIRWIGKKAEMLFLTCNIQSVEMLLFVLKRNALADYTTQRLNSYQSIEKTIRKILQTNLPIENIRNIVKVLQQTFSPRLLVQAP